MKVAVLDTSALLAYFYAEKGGMRVKELLASGSTTRCYIHAANSIELLHGISREFDFALAEECHAALLGMGVIVETDMDAAFQVRCAVLKNAFPMLSLGDVLTISLAERLKAVVVTADKAFNRARKVADVELIR